MPVVTQAHASCVHTSSAACDTAEVISIESQSGAIGDLRMDVTLSAFRLASFEATPVLVCFASWPGRA